MNLQLFTGTKPLLNISPVVQLSALDLPEIFFLQHFKNVYPEFNKQAKNQFNTRNMGPVTMLQMLIWEKVWVLVLWFILQYVNQNHKMPGRLRQDNQQIHSTSPRLLGKRISKSGLWDTATFCWLIRMALAVAADLAPSQSHWGVFHKAWFEKVRDWHCNDEAAARIRIQFNYTKSTSQTGFYLEVREMTGLVLIYY